MLSVIRSPRNPFLSPTRTHAFEAIGTFNPSVVTVDGETHMFYRAMSEPDALRTPGRGFSTVGYASSKNGGAFENRQQVLAADDSEHSFDRFGCEDPRATYFEGKWYVFYTALSEFPFRADGIRAAVAIGTSPTELTERHLVTPFNAKAATLFPERIDGDAVLMVTAHTDWTEEHQRPTIGIARSKNIEDFWNPTFWDEWHAHLGDHALPDVRRADTDHMEVAATPILTDEGWLLVYSHIQNYYDEPHRIFGVEALLLDAENPQKVLRKTEFPFLVPEESYEKYGIVSNVIFPTSVTRTDDTLTIYYGAADTVCASAALSYTHLLSCMDPASRDSFVTRTSDQPLLHPIPDHHWESASVSNAAAIDIEGAVYLLYRAATADNYSSLGFAKLTDALHVDERLPEPVYKPRTDIESHGTEDPRLTRIGDTLYLTYTAFNGSRARGALSSISVADFLAHKFDQWSTPFTLTPDSTDDKDICILPELVQGKALIIHRIDPTICAHRTDDMPPVHEIDTCIEIMGPRTGMWDARKVGAAGPPIRIPEGWLFIYHAVGADGVYRLGAALLDSETATTVIARTNAPIFSPVLPWEKLGVVNNVIFSCGAILREDTLYIYYGGADTAIGIATLSKRALVERLLPTLAHPQA
jgi:predicted GH43/DUF377 family glycosyl hydrolase